MARIKGIDRLILRLHKLDKEIQEQVKLAVETSTQSLKEEAVENVKRVARNPGEDLYEASIAISQNIDVEITGDRLVGRVVVNAGAMGAYVEFGTGIHAAHWVPMLPQEWQKAARAFYKNGRGTLPAAPYLYPAYFKQRKEFVRMLREALRKAIK